MKVSCIGDGIRATEEHPQRDRVTGGPTRPFATATCPIATVVDEDVIWHVPGSHRRAGDIRGRDALLAWLASLAPLGFWLREHDVFGMTSTSAR
jgi:hypothetical protein